MVRRIRYRRPRRSRPIMAFITRQTRRYVRRMTVRLGRAISIIRILRLPTAVRPPMTATAVYRTSRPRRHFVGRLYTPRVPRIQRTPSTIAVTIKIAAIAPAVRTTCIVRVKHHVLRPVYMQRRIRYRWYYRRVRRSSHCRAVTLRTVELIPRCRPHMLGMRTRCRRRYIRYTVTRPARPARSIPPLRIGICAQPIAVTIEIAAAPICPARRRRSGVAAGPVAPARGGVHRQNPARQTPVRPAVSGAERPIHFPIHMTAVRHYRMTDTTGKSICARMLAMTPPRRRIRRGRPVTTAAYRC